MILSRQKILALVLNILGVTEICVSKTCDGGCCDGYKLDPETGKCIRCAPGYFGTDCSFACLYPLYGYRCQSVCLCKEEKCNPIQGCSDMSTNFSSKAPLSSSSDFFPRTQEHEFYVEERVSINKGITSLTEEKRTSAKSVEKDTSGSSMFPYVMSIFVLILLLTVTYTGNCAFKRFCIRQNVNVPSANTQAAHTEENTNSVERDESYEVIDEITHTNNRQMRQIVYKRPVLSEDTQTLRNGDGSEESTSCKTRKQSSQKLKRSAGEAKNPYLTVLN